jgi:hypothetical protein
MHGRLRGLRGAGPRRPDQPERRHVAQPAAPTRNRDAIILGNQAMRQIKSATPALWAAISAATPARGEIAAAFGRAARFRLTGARVEPEEPARGGGGVGGERLEGR